MSTLKTPFRYDFVGSFLRPEKLKAAKKAFEEGTITQEELDRVTDECVTEIVAKQKVAGYHAITDGEFRRKFWHLDFMWGFEGVTHEKDGGGVQFNGEMADLEATYLVGKVKAKVHPFVEYFKFLKQFEDEQTVAKYTIPAPAQMYQQMIVPQNIEQTRKFYATDDELIEDIGKAYQDVIKQFYSAGCRNLQLDDCTWGAIVGDAAKQRYQSLGVDIEEVKARLLKVNNLALEGRPEDMVITSHICRGNYHSTFFTSGPYDSVADYVFAQEHVDALLLEYDDARSGGFAPLAKVSPDKKVVLGLITTKKPELEDKDKVIARIHEAAKYNGKELDRKGGLDWYDYGARHYDSVLGRWNGVDPSCEKHYSWSPYVYCKNNPVLRIDPDGKDDYVINYHGQLQLMRRTNRIVDVLYASGTSGTVSKINPEWKNIKVFDKSILPALETNLGNNTSGADYFAETSSAYDAANIATFDIENTGVEWKYTAGYRDGEKKYIIGNSSRDYSVSTLEGINNNPFEGFQPIVDIHSHPSTQGASEHDMLNAKGKNGVSFGVYFKDNKTLYEYNSVRSNLNSIKMNSMLDLMRYTFRKYNENDEEE